jgi:hypothetical protein
MQRLLLPGKEARSGDSEGHRATVEKESDESADCPSPHRLRTTLLEEVLDRLCHSV